MNKALKDAEKISIAAKELEILYNSKIEHLKNELSTQYSKYACIKKENDLLQQKN